MPHLPAFTFTVPSIHDDTVLDCRIYNPLSLSNYTPWALAAWRKKAAIVAHPYAPLGGSYDDAIVDIVASELLMNNFIVCTFNFRGAGYSKGRTSWTSKPETKDYISLIGFMVYFMHHSSMSLTIPSGGQSRADHEISYELSPVPSQALPPMHDAKNLTSDKIPILDSSPKSPDSFLSQDRYTQENSHSSHVKPVLLLAGYSYGALITTQLPDLSSINSIFSTPEVGSAAAEIRFRAEQLAMKQNELIASILASAQAKFEGKSNAYQRGRSLHDTLSPRTCSSASSIRVGGEETNADIRKASHDSPVRRSFSIDTPEQIRKSIDKVRSLGRYHKDSTQPNSPRGQISPPNRSPVSLDGADSSSSLGTQATEAPTSLATPDKLPLLALDDLQPAYLLVSPLQGLITSLATMWTSSPSNVSPFPSLSAKRQNPKSEAGTPQPPSASPDHSLLTNPTLAVSGTNDIFTSSKKLRAWTRRLQNARDSRFCHVEVHSAGHFWHEDGVADVMRRAVREFVSGL